MSKWYNESVVPRNKVQTLINDVNSFNENCLQTLKTKVLLSLKNHENDCNSVIKISEMFDVVSNPFINLQSEYKRMQLLENMGLYIKPIEITIGSKYKEVMKDGNILVETVNVNICFISLRSVFKVFFEQPNVLKTILKYFDDLMSESEDITFSYIQSEVWKEKCRNNPGKIVIPFFLYFDEYETANPLGSHAGKKKVGAVYVSFGSCFPPEFSSCLNYIFLAQLFNANDKKTFGNKIIFKQLIAEINYL